MLPKSPGASTPSSAFSSGLSRWQPLQVWKLSLRFRVQRGFGGQLLGGTSTGGARLVVSYGLTATVYTAHLYANFAGYMDIVIGVGLLIGLRLPENFARPFTARRPLPAKKSTVW